MKKERLVVRALLIFVTFLTFSSLSAQENGTPMANKKWALQYQVSNNFTLSSFKGSVISAKYNLSESNAIRFGLSLEMRKTTNEYDQGSENGYSSSYNTLTGDDDYYRAALSTEYLWHNNVFDNLDFYFGGGPSVYIEYDYDNSSTNSIQADTLYRVANQVSKSNDLGIGLSYAVGAEWFVTDFLGICAEYHGGFYYSTVKTKRTSTSSYTNPDYNENISTSDQNNKTFSFSSSQVRLGLSVYF